MGGRSSVSGLTVTVFGASGQVGRYIANRFGNDHYTLLLPVAGRSGTQLVIPFRGDEYDIAPIKLMGDLGRIHFARFNLRDHAQIIECVRHSDVVINLIAQDRRTLNFTMRDVNVEGAASIARACHQAGVPRLIHASCLRARPDAPSEYSRTKAEGEKEVRREFPQAIIVRPATIFGPQDRCINGIGQFAHMPPGFPILGDGMQIKRPIHVSNITDAIISLARSDEQVDGKVFDLVGPRAYTYRRLVELFAFAAMLPCKMISLTPITFWLYGKIFPEIRRALFPLDSIRQLLEDEPPLDPTHLGFSNLGFHILDSLEDHLLEIARRYRHTAEFGRPLVFPPELLQDSLPNKQ